MRRWGMLLCVLWVGGLAGCPSAGHRPPPPGTIQEAPEEVSKLRQQAMRGDVEAQYRLGLMYHTGEGLPQHDASAVQWLQRAATQGSAEAQRLLGRMYLSGQGDPATRPRLPPGIAGRPTKVTPKPNGSWGGCTSRARESPATRRGCRLVSPGGRPRRPRGAMAAGTQILAWLGRAAGCRPSLPLAGSGRRASATRQTPGSRYTGVSPGGTADDASPVGPGARTDQPVAAPEGTLVPLDWWLDASAPRASSAGAPPAGSASRARRRGGISMACSLAMAALPRIAMSPDEYERLGDERECIACHREPERPPAWRTSSLRSYPAGPGTYGPDRPDRCGTRQCGARRSVCATPGMRRSAAPPTVGGAVGGTDREDSR
jgi:hypothetical protein